MKTPATRPFGKHPDVTVWEELPFNAETPLGLLRRSYVTPRKLFYVRNHGAVPEVDADGYRLAVSGLVDEPLELSLQQIKGEFPKTELTLTLVCAGNRRDELMRIRPMPGKLPWNGGAAGNARWAGARLRDVLLAAGTAREARHVAFTGLDKVGEGGQQEGTRFGGSVPIEKGMGEDVVLAYEMNGEPLAPEHGFPLRAVVGGYVGARSVKWLSDVTLQDGPSANYYQAREYKLFPPHVTEETADPSGGTMLGELPLNAVVCDPAEGATLSTSPIPVRGYAIAGGERRVERVEVSADGGRTWVEADLTDDAADRSGAWRFWEAGVELDRGPNRIVARALDSASGTQPEDAGEVWNFQGYANNAWHGVDVRLGRRSS